MTRRDMILGSLGAGVLLKGATAATVTVSTTVAGVIGPLAGLSCAKKPDGEPGLFKLTGPSLLRIGQFGG